jgi:hypothetical protein
MESWAGLGPAQGSIVPAGFDGGRAGVPCLSGGSDDRAARCLRWRRGLAARAGGAGWRRGLAAVPHVPWHARPVSDIGQQRTDPTSKPDRRLDSELPRGWGIFGLGTWTWNAPDTPRSPDPPQSFLQVRRTFCTQVLPRHASTNRRVAVPVAEALASRAELAAQSGFQPDDPPATS